MTSKDLGQGRIGAHWILRTKSLHAAAEFSNNSLDCSFLMNHGCNQLTNFNELLFSEANEVNICKLTKMLNCA
jgi:hypothetical protein